MMVHWTGRTDDIMNRKSTRTGLPSRTAVALGLGLLVLGVSGCGESAAPVASKNVKTYETKVDSTKKPTRKSRLEAPNADLGPRERRALKAKGELPQ
jgi:hypothetical protein